MIKEQQYYLPFTDFLSGYLLAISIVWDDGSVRSIN